MKLEEAELKEAYKALDSDKVMGPSAYVLRLGVGEGGALRG